MIHLGSAPTLHDCQNECQLYQDCEYFTWFENDLGCLLFADCDFNSTVCTDCYTGAVDCTLDHICFDEGICFNGTFIDYDFLSSADECLDLCYNNPECKWFSYNPAENNGCYLTTDCPQIDRSCTGSGCVYGQVECREDMALEMNIMVATGWNGSGNELDHVEVISNQTLKSCSNLPAKFPRGVREAIALKYNSEVVICGGTDAGPHTGDCYGYSNDQWTIRPFTLEPPRHGAMSVEIKPGEWLVMGGWDGQPTYYLTDTQLFKNGIFTQGPELPEQIYGGSAVMLNETHLFVAAADNHEIVMSSKNYLLDVNTEQWTEIANRTLPPSAHHSSGTFYNSSAGEIQVANIGYEGIETYSPRDDIWISGIPYPPDLSKLDFSLAVQQGVDSFILIGGYADNDYSGDIYQFNENGLSILMKNALTVPRDSHVVMPIGDQDFSCN